MVANLDNNDIMLKVVKMSKMYAKSWFKRNAESKSALDNVTMGVEKGNVLVLVSFLEYIIHI